VGESQQVTAWAADVVGRPWVHPFDGMGEPDIQWRGERVRMEVRPRRPGWYAIPGPDHVPVVAMAVHVDPRESDLRTVDPETLARRVTSGTPDARAVRVDRTHDYEVLLRGKPWHGAMLILALAWILAEGWLLQRRFMPRPQTSTPEGPDGKETR
jgi:hypothetical protein